MDFAILRRTVIASIPLYFALALSSPYSLASSVYFPLNQAHLYPLNTFVSSEDKTRSYDAKSTEIYEVTAYTSGYESTGKRKGHPAYGVTASGRKVREGYTAACPRDMQFGTRVSIDGVGERVCEDRGGAIRGKRLDIYIADLKQAREFGRQTLEVTIIRSP